MKLLLIKHCLWSAAYLIDAYKLECFSIAAIFKTGIISGLRTESIAYEFVAYETVDYWAFAYKTVAYKSVAYKTAA